ncbi:MAG: hypothetical protein ABR972_14525 [Acidimicrobiales bacterium]|jgi:hypothetical protein
MSELAELEALLDDEHLRNRIAEIESALPVGVRPRQLSLRTLLIGMFVCLDAGRPAHLTRVHEALCSLCENEAVGSIVGYP